MWLRKPLKTIWSRQFKVFVNEADCDSIVCWTFISTVSSKTIHFNYSGSVIPWCIDSYMSGHRQRSRDWGVDIDEVMLPMFWCVIHTEHLKLNRFAFWSVLCSKFILGVVTIHSSWNYRYWRPIFICSEWFAKSRTTNPSSQSWSAYLLTKFPSNY